MVVCRIHPDVAIHLACWASPRYGIAVTRLVRRFQTGQVTTAESVAASHELAQQVDVVDSDESAAEVEAPEVPEPPTYVARQILQDRMDSIAVTNAKNRVVRESFPGTSPWEYASLASMSNQISMNFTTTTTVFKKQNNIPARFSIPDVIDEVGLSRRTIAEAGFGLWIKANVTALRAMSNKERIAAYKERKRDLQRATDIFDPRKPGLLTIPTAKRNRSELDTQRKKQCIWPSQNARNLISF